MQGLLFSFAGIGTSTETDIHCIEQQRVHKISARHVSSSQASAAFLHWHYNTGAGGVYTKQDK